MDINELFNDTQAEIAEFRDLLEEELGGRASETLTAILRNDPWGSIAVAARDDERNPDLADLAADIRRFGDSMDESEQLWWANGGRA